MNVEFSDMIGRLEKLPSESQQQIFELINFFYLKAFSSTFNELIEKEVQIETSLDDRLELKQRISNYENHPETAIDGNSMKSKWEKKLGIQL